MRRTTAFIAIALSLTAACGGGEKSGQASTPGAAAASPSATPGAPVTPCATCKVIVVTMTSNEKGNFFTPNDIKAHKGDVLRFTLTVGVHNVNFLPDSNAGKSGLPAASALLQLPGQTWDIPLTFGEGTFYFQCDPHVLLGMKGHVRVED